MFSLYFCFLTIFSRLCFNNLQRNGTLYKAPHTHGTKYKSRSTGELEKSLGLSKVRLDRNGNYNIKIGFAESRRDGSSNAKIANTIEYGKSGQVAKPFMKPAKSSSKSKCIEVMKATFDKEVNNI